MILANPNPSCENARLYYYDFVREETKRNVPQSVLEHINQCQHCQDEIDRLEALLVQSEKDSEQSQRDAAIIAILKLHFSYIGKAVTCTTVKPFLPSLAVPDLEVGIPTPITAHLDKCQACSDDLSALRNFGLTNKQLHRLGQFLADRRDKDTVSCSQARPAIPSVVEMVFRDTRSEVLRHLCACPDCREQLYQQREAIRKRLLRTDTPRNEFPCKAVSTTDIYNYCLPYGIDPADDQYVEFRESLTSHLGSCPTCLAKMQELHRKIFNIADRAESDIVTVYHMVDSAEAGSLSQSGELYAGFPIRVEVASHQDRVDAEQPAEAIGFAAGLKRNISALNIKPLLKPGLAAAAVILIAFSLLLNTPTAKAVTIEQIYKAIESIKNVYVATFAGDEAEPIQERWVSRTLNVYMSKTGQESALSDISNKVQTVKHLDTGSVKTAPLSDEMATEIEKKISGTLGLLPFEKISDLPENGKWSQLADDGLEPIARDTDVDVYDLTWQKYGGSVMFKWRFFVERKTSLPLKTEFYQKLPDDTEYIKMSTMVVTYLTDGEMQALIKEARF